MINDRRKYERHHLNLECDWTRNARVTDMSLGGCYVDASSVPSPGKLIDITLPLNGISTTISGRVVHSKQGIGFALEFVEPSDALLERLQAMLATPQ